MGEETISGTCVKCGDRYHCTKQLTHHFNNGEDYVYCETSSDMIMGDVTIKTFPMHLNTEHFFYNKYGGYGLCPSCVGRELIIWGTNLRLGGDNARHRTQAA